MTNKKFKLAAMSLATAVAVSTVGPSASAVTYYLVDGSVTVDKDEERGAYSYQGEDQGENRTYVNEDKAETGDGTIYVEDGHAPTTDNSNNGTEETTLTDTTTDSSGNNTENSSTSETTTEKTITVMEDVKKTDKVDGTEGNDVKIVVEGVNVDTSETGKSTVTIGEGADAVSYTHLTLPTIA